MHPVSISKLVEVPEHLSPAQQVFMRSSATPWAVAASASALLGHQSIWQLPDFQWPGSLPSKLPVLVISSSAARQSEVFAG